MTTLGLRDVLAELEATGDYRILRRAKWRSHYSAHTPTPGVDLKLGLYVDTETTSKEPNDAKIVELAVVLFEFDTAGTIYGVSDGWSWLNDPGIPIPADATAIHGITDDDVRGRHIDLAVFESLVQNVVICVAHNALYDRQILEREFPVFATLPWGCSYRDVPWDRFGCPVQRLDYLLTGACREFRDNAHRALDDCKAGIHVLATASLDDRSAFSYLLEHARRRTVRIWADGARKSTKDALKARGYRALYVDGDFVAWWIDIAVSDARAEIAWLDYHAPCTPRWRVVTAKERYSARIERW